MPAKKKEDERKKLPADSGSSKSGSGKSKSDFIYDEAEWVRPGKGLDVQVSYKGEWYTAQLTWGQAQDGDPDKCTVLVQLKDERWAKLWFWEENLH